MKRFYFLLVILICQEAVAQEASDLTPVLPRVIGASPEAASLGQYGNAPVNLSTGQINYTIPIHTIKVGEYEFPLTLSYNYAGFKPDTDPTMVGMGWTANFNGAIVRQLQGMPDEYPTDGYFVRGDTYANLDDLSEASKAMALEAAADDGADTRPDRFIINTPKLSGTFRFNTAKTPVFSEQRNYKVILPNNTLGTMNILDDKGILHKFSVGERTINRNWSAGGSEDEVDYTSSWMIKEITLPDSKGTINFIYDDYDFYSEHHTKTKSLKSPLRGGINKTVTLHESINQVQSKIITRINFPGGYILFDQDVEPRTVTTTTIGNQQFNYNTDNAQLQAISVYNSNDQLISKYMFDYYDKGYYYFLKSIKKEGQNGEMEDYYSFDYYNLDEVPANRISNDKVDLWGFYNSVSYDEDNLASSMNSSFDHGVIGALKQITYPTKGTTEIIYESNEIKRSGSYYDSSNPVYDETEFVTVSSEDGGQDFDDRTKEVEIPFGQTVEVILEVDVTADHAVAESALRLENNDYVTMLLENGAEVPVQVYASEENMGSDEERHIVKTYSVPLSKGIYKLYTEIGEIGYGEGTHFAKAAIKYRKIPYSQDPVANNISVGGIRVSETQDCPDGTSNCVIKKYNYLSGYSGHPDNESSGFLTDLYPRFRSIKIEHEDIRAQGVIKEANGDVTVLSILSTELYDTYNESYHPITPLTSMASHIFYKRVEIVNRNESIGKTTKKFSFFGKNLQSGVFRDLYEDVDFKVGKITDEELIKNNGSELQSEQTKKNIYNETTFNPSEHVFDCKVIRYPKITTAYEVDVSTNEIIGVETVSTVNSFFMESIEHQTKGYQLTSSTTTLKEVNGNIMTETSYVYDPDTGLLSETSQTNSDGKTIAKKTYYPNNSSLLTGLSSSQQSAIDDLMNQNKLSTPIQTERIVKDSDGTVLSKITKRTNFKNWGNDVVMPETIQVSSGSNALEDRIVYHGYDDNNGTLLEVGKADDEHFSYIWGYNGKYPIAKLENAIYSSITETTIADLQAKSNLDDDHCQGVSGCDEAILRSALNGLRSDPVLTNSKITTYTFDPLVGITSQTDPNGITTYYEYDDFGRLQRVIDKDGNILKKIEYQFRQF